MTVKNEIEQTMMRYFYKDGIEIHFFGQGNGAKRFLDFYQYGDKYLGDAPDMVILKNKEALIVEHFEFDCYCANRKGSQNRKEQSRIRRASAAIIPTEEGIEFHDYIRGESSNKSYLQNVCRSFEEHYAHIPMYQDNLKNERIVDGFIKTEVMFLIEDVSPLGAEVIEREGYSTLRIPIVLAQCKEFLDLLRERPKVDYILACSSVENNQYVWFIDQTEINRYYQNTIDYESMQFLAYTPRVSQFKMLVSEEMINKGNGNL